jgi:hypothetical protein
MESKDELVFINFFVHPILLSFATNITCDLSKAIKGILIATIAYDQNFVLETSLFLLVHYNHDVIYENLVEFDLGASKPHSKLLSKYLDACE